MPVGHILEAYALSSSLKMDSWCLPVQSLLIKHTVLKYVGWCCSCTPWRKVLCENAYACCCNETAVLVSPEQFVAYPEYPSGSVNSLWLSDLRNTVEMKGFVDAPNYFIELLEGGTTLDNVIDNHVYEQNLVSSENHSLSKCQTVLWTSVLVNKWNTAVLFLSFSLIDLILFVRLKRMYLLWPTLGP